MGNVTNIYYKGDVSLKLKINGKFYEVSDHNEGLDYLMYSFAVFLTGNYTGNSAYPEYIDLRRIEAGSDIELSYLKYLSPITAKRYFKDNDEWVAEFTVSLQSEQLLDTINVDDPSTYTLYMVSGFDNDNSAERQHDLAKLRVSTSVLSQITPGMTASLVWAMKLTNYQET